MKNNNFKETIYLTFDIDWASDEVLKDTFKLLDEIGAKATFFVTHKSSIISEQYSNLNLDFGIHPNFNKYINLTETKQLHDLVKDLIKIVPDAKAVRSHSLFQSSPIIEMFRECGITHDINNFLPFEAKLKNKAYYHWNGLVRVPFGWEDDVYFLHDKPYKNLLIEDYLSVEGLKVFNFHPIHVYLNTIDYEHYLSSKDYGKQIEMLNKMINKEKKGIRDFLIELVRIAKSKDYEFGFVRENVVCE